MAPTSKRTSETKPDKAQKAQRLKRSTGESGEHWLYGAHAALAALMNPKRKCHQLLLAPEFRERYGTPLREALTAQPDINPEILEKEAIAALLPDAAVHQGIALLCDPLRQPGLEEVLANGKADDRSLLVVLDQVSDPQNIGAVLRSAAAFDADAVITTERHAPTETAALVKAASGGFEHVPYIAVVNLARAVQDLKRSGFWCVGLTGEASGFLETAVAADKVALVLGAEGSGLRRLTRDSCDELARLPTPGAIHTLNISTAAAIALYACQRRRATTR